MPLTCRKSTQRSTCWWNCWSCGGSSSLWEEGTCCDFSRTVLPFRRGAGCPYIYIQCPAHLHQWDSCREWLYDRANFRVRAVMGSLVRVGYGEPRHLPTGKLAFFSVTVDKNLWRTFGETSFRLTTCIPLSVSCLNVQRTPVGNVGSISLGVPLRVIKFISRTPMGNKVH